jgi:hypothetical protein
MWVTSALPGIHRDRLHVTLFRIVEQAATRQIRDRHAVNTSLQARVPLPAAHGLSQTWRVTDFKLYRIVSQVLVKPGGF